MTPKIAATWLKAEGHPSGVLVRHHFDSETFDLMTETRRLLADNGKPDWTVAWDNAKRRAGGTHFKTRQITYSRVLMPNYPRSVQWEVMLHEVAHALLGPRHGHNQNWKHTVRALGGTPTSTLPSDLPSAPPRWVGVCPKCGKRRELHSAPRRVVSCGDCSPKFDTELVFRWHLHGTETVPPGAYSKELRRLQHKDPCQRPATCRERY